MPKNQGKKGKDFEAQFKKSCDNQGICAIRLIDSNKFGKHDSSRFTPCNVADFICYDGNILVLAELKSTKGTSISFNQPCDKVAKGTFMIKPKQVLSLMKHKDFKKVVPLLILDFRVRLNMRGEVMYGGTYAIPIDVFVGWSNCVDKKSINQHDAESIGIKIDKRLKKVNYEYDIQKLFDDLQSNAI